ncbi:fatty-acid--CoA ligase, partial [Escherichia coli]|nr:fatty-acid--CoA ligase [Escherichia coli]
AHVVLRANAAPDADALRAFCGERLAAYKVPREFTFAQALPRTPTGKLQKFLLRVRRG